MEKYGFVYIWYDRKHKRYYIGCRWGDVSDGYVCSSVWMKRAYLRRPQDFKRKILKKIYTCKLDLLDAEYFYLKLIKPEELGTKYYNLKNHHFGHWSSDPIKAKSATEKSCESNRKRIANMTPEQRKAMYGTRKGKDSPNKGKKLSDERKQYISSVRTGTKRSLVTIEKLRGRVPWNKGKTNVYSEETLKKISQSRMGLKLGPRSSETKAKIGKKNSAHMKKLWLDETYRIRQSNSHKKTKDV